MSVLQPRHGRMDWQRWGHVPEVYPWSTVALRHRRQRRVRMRDTTDSRAPAQPKSKGDVLRRVPPEGSDPVLGQP